MDIREFLLARIDEDEAAAMATTPGGAWHAYTDYTQDDRGQLVHEDSTDRIGGMVSTEDAAHAARWQPARVLAECQVKRQIIGLSDDALLHLAAMYADHPDYRPEWASSVAVPAV